MHISRGRLPTTRFATEEPDTRGYRAARMGFLIGCMLLFVLTIIQTVRMGAGWGIVTANGFFLPVMVIGIAPRIRPGTKTFWRALAAVACLWLAPTLSLIWPGLGGWFVAGYAVFAMWISWRSRATLREDTWGRRLLFVGGILLGGVIVLMCI